MEFTVHVHIHDHQGGPGLDRIERLLTELLAQGKHIMADLTALTTQVTANTDVEASAVVLIQGIAAQLAAAKNDPVAIQALVDKLNTSKDALAAAVAANTPAA